MRFLGYLRGIETPTHQVDTEGILKFLGYLRGIETIIHYLDAYFSASF